MQNPDVVRQAEARPRPKAATFPKGPKTPRAGDKNPFAPGKGEIAEAREQLARRGQTQKANKARREKAAPAFAKKLQRAPPEEAPDAGIGPGGCVPEIEGGFKGPNRKNFAGEGGKTGGGNLRAEEERAHEIKKKKRRKRRGAPGEPPPR
ncbi:MAG: hypothetical protein CM15mP55_0230 [Hyphomicrobiales bacterium]|nr:MAG: hypothetical protein CM15mP55_0230 [Hyphomicrobiales bacterium]